MRRGVLGSILVALMLSGCFSSGPMASPTSIPLTATPLPPSPPPDVSATKIAQAGVVRRRSLDELDQEQSKWDAPHITNYFLSIASHIQFSNGAPFGQEKTTVMNGSVVNVEAFSCVVESACVPSKTIATVYTVPMLFTQARQFITSPNCITAVYYDNHYGIPVSIQCGKAPGQTDGEFSIVVTTFTVLSGTME